MPILPPRNLPLSPADGGGDKGKREAALAGRGAISSPTVRKAGSGSSPSTPVKGQTASSLALSPSQGRQSSPLSAAASQLERQDETTFHRRLRSILYDHRSAREAWDDIVSIEGAKSIASLSQLATQLETSLSKGTSKVPEPYATLPNWLQISDAQYESNTLSEIAKLARAVMDERDYLDSILKKLSKSTIKMEAISDAANTLLIECTRTKGDQFAFQQEAWTTWPIVRFVDVLQTLTSRYAVQTEHLSTLRDIMLRDTILLDTITSDTSKEGMDEEDSDEEDSDVTQSKANRKKTALIRQRILEEWQALPYLQGDRHCQDSEWFEDICEAEVGRWNE